ncbi:response regulator [Paenibacillus athensensis]|nr:ATP-binding protein [Paenibacillus athensensis]MCD1260471.1 response regulator [Paenibacillus athensensis]
MLLHQALIVRTPMMKRTGGWITFLFICAMLSAALLTESGSSAASAATPAPINGTLDVSGWDAAAGSLLELDDGWELIWGRLLEPRDFLASSAPERTGLFAVPSFWRKYRVDGQPLPDFGFATYRLVVTNYNGDQPLSLKLRNIYSSAALWVNGKRLYTIGQPGTTAASTVPRFAPSAVVDLGDPGPRLELVIQVANFSYPRGGINNALLLGTTQQLRQMKQNEVMQDSFVFGALVIMTIYHLILYLLRRKDVSPLYFACFCLCIAVRTLLVNSRFLLDLYPDFSWVWFGKLSYLTVYVALYFIASFIYHLFPAYFSRRVLQVSRWLSVGLTLLTVFADISWYDRSLPIFEAYTAFLLLYGIYTAFRATRDRQDGAWLFIVGFLVLLTVSLNDTVKRLSLIETPTLLQHGVLVVIFLQSVILSLKFAKTYAQAERLSERLLSLDKLKDEFLAKTSHELRTPLVGMIGLGESLLEGVHGPLPAPAAQMLQLMTVSGKRLSHLVNDILDFAKIKNNDLQLRPVAVDLAQAAELVVLLLGPLAAKKGLLLVNRIPAGLLVYADEDRVQQIFHNLLGNAIKFTEAGSIELSAQRLEKQVLVRVVDTGIGIAAEDQSRIFDSFEQLDGTMERYGGTGIGLTITRQLVELHGGEIRVSSAPGEGAAFTFTLPAVERLAADGADAVARGAAAAARGAAAAARGAAAAARGAVARGAGAGAGGTVAGAQGAGAAARGADAVGGAIAADQPPLAPGGSATQPPGASAPPGWPTMPADAPLRPDAGPADAPAAAHDAADEQLPTVMVVDDDPINVQVLVHFLHGRYRVIETTRPQEALRWLQNGFAPDIVLLDIMMPHISGFQLCRQIRNAHSFSELPVIFLSAKSQIADLTTAFELGANDYLLKPADKQELLARIDLHLRLAQWNRSLERELTVRTDKLKRMMEATAVAMSELSVLEERNRIARDIHDQVGHTLTASIVQMEAGLHMLDKNLDAARDRLQLVAGLVRQGLREMRQSVHTLHEQELQLDLFSALIKLIQDTERYADVTIEHELEPLTEPLRSELEQLLLHALQEGLTNGIRHGRCRRFRLQLKQQDGQIGFVLDNDGEPYRAERLGFGLSAMKRQVESWQGSLSVGTAPTAGCRLDIRIPLQRR